MDPRLAGYVWIFVLGGVIALRLALRPRYDLQLSLLIVGVLYAYALVPDPGSNVRVILGLILGTGGLVLVLIRQLRARTRHSVNN